MVTCLAENARTSCISCRLYERTPQPRLVAMESDRGAYKQDEALAFDLLETLRSIAQQYGMGTRDLLERVLAAAVTESRGQPPEP